MGTAIITSSIDFGGTILQEKNGQYSRTLSIGNNYNVIRAGALVSFDNSGGNFSEYLIFGIINSGDNLVAGTPLSHTRYFYSGNTYLYAGGSLPSYSANNMGMGSHRNGTFTLGGLFNMPSNFGIPTIDGTIKRRGLIGFQFDKTTGSRWTMDGFMGDKYLDYNYTDLQTFLNYGSCIGKPVYKGNSQPAWTTNTNETTGKLDTIAIHWANTTYGLYLYAMGVSTLS